MVKKNFLLY